MRAWNCITQGMVYNQDTGIIARQELLNELDQELNEQ